jgi:membrane protein DedA with SNARE-associated domain
MIAPAVFASTAIILLSFVSEDAATISSALSIFGGPLSWPLGFAACFIGIWLGDLGLYALARCLGRPILQRQWVARFADAASIERCQEKFNQRGSLTLLVSRFVPGTRLPTYLAAGLLSMPPVRFALITALAAFLWIGGIFSITKLLGSQTLTWFSSFQSKIAAIVLTALLIGGALFLLKKLCRTPVWVRRWMRWEFWPSWLFYIPVGVYYLWLAMRYRGFSVPTSANPGMASGGFIGESKLEILNKLRRGSREFVAEAFLLDGKTTSDRLLCLHRLCREHKITLPFILKPDVGQRGNGVKLIRSMRAALEYLEEVNAPVIVQRYAVGRHEAGVFYYRFPGESGGHIFAITEKIFPAIVGDGTRSIEELIRADSRASLMARIYLQRFANRRNEILAPGETLRLVETGNHAQGCIFRDGMHLYTDALEGVIDEISRRLAGFFIGRYDLRYENEEDFTQVRNFQIVELNGATSEATSIYDARNSLFSAYRTLFRQWRLVFAIGARNRANGHAPSSLSTLWQNWRQYSAASLSYPLAD